VCIGKDGGAAHETLFRLGDGASYNVPLEVEECALTMRRGEVCTLRTPRHTYLLTLLAFEKERALYKAAAEEVLEAAQELKLRGNSAYKMNKLRLAQLYYERCMVYLDGIVKSEQDASTAELLRDCNLNLAQVHLGQEQFPSVISNATTVLWTYPGNVKALYRRAVAYHQLGFLDEAYSDLVVVTAAEPTNKPAAALLGQVKGGRLRRNQEEKQHMLTVFQASLLVVYCNPYNV